VTRKRRRIRVYRINQESCSSDSEEWSLLFTRGPCGSPTDGAIGKWETRDKTRFHQARWLFRNDRAITSGWRRVDSTSCSRGFEGDAISVRMIVALLVVAVADNVGPANLTADGAPEPRLS
jgi:hypothetical protein